MCENGFLDDNVSEEKGVVVQFFDLEDPLSRFKSLLEELWHVSLSDYSIWLQGTQQLDEDKNFIEYGVEGEGKVQIKLQVKMMKDGVKMINILDVLKPIDENIDAAHSYKIYNDPDEFPLNFSDTCVQWVESKDFITETLLHSIPSDPEEWTIESVKYWILWAVKAFKLKNINLEHWNITGKEVLQLAIDEYKQKVPSDPKGNFWTHLQILQKCGQIAICLDEEKKKKISKIFNNNKPVTLLKFLLELLTDKAYIDIITWLNDDGEFHIVKPDTLARLWGEKKQRDNMTYDKLSRALRYYYRADIMSKVPFKRFVYKFHCDIKELVGYSPMELNASFKEL